MTTPPFDTAQPNVARMYDYWLGGKDRARRREHVRPGARAGVVRGDLGGVRPGRTGTDFASTYNAQSGPRIYAHSWPEITGLFSGLELVPPGIVETTAWLPGQPDTVPEQRSNMIVAGVGRRLLPPGMPIPSGLAGGDRPVIKYPAAFL